MLDALGEKFDHISDGWTQFPFGFYLSNRYGLAFSANINEDA